MEAAAGGGGKIRRSAFRIARGLGRRVRRREEEPRRADRDPLCNISSIDHYTHRRRAGSPRALAAAASRQQTAPRYTHTVSLGPSTCAVGRLSLSLSLSFSAKARRRRRRRRPWTPVTGRVGRRDTGETRMLRVRETRVREPDDFRMPLPRAHVSRNNRPW